MLAPDPWPAGRRLFLMRHGETYEPRLESPMASRAEDPELPLTPRGRTQLTRVAQALASLGLDTARCSPFRRSLETAGIVTAALGLEVRPLAGIEELPLHPPPGGTLRDVARRYLALARALEESAPADVRLDDGRPLEQVVAQALDSVRNALEQGGRRVLVVAHGGLNRFLLAHWLGLPLRRFLSLDQDFGCVNVIDFVRGGWPWVRAVNVTLHDPFKTEEPIGSLDHSRREP